MKKNLILITGPSGGGKTALAEYISEKRGYIMVSEDIFWGEFTKDRIDYDGFRTEEEEVIIRAQVTEHINKLLEEDKDVVLEFILYCEPPRPLIAYTEAFETRANIIVAVLNPSADSVVTRKLKRGRGNENNTNIAEETKYIENWRKLIKTPYIKKEWIIDNNNLTVEETFRKIFDNIRE